MADPRLFPYDIEVDAKDKDLVLLGKVSQESDKKAATDIVRCLEGVHAVENRLKIEPDAPHGLVAERDKVVTQLVKERFEKSKTLQSVKFDVKTEDGVVTPQRKHAVSDHRAGSGSGGPTSAGRAGR